MSQPPSPFERSYSFTDNSTANPTSQQPGNKIDQELNNARTAINATISRLGEIQRDDGKVRDSALNLDTIAQAVSPVVSVAATQAINSAGATQVSAINSSGAAQISAINAAGTSNLASLNALINSTNATNAANAAANSLNASIQAEAHRDSALYSANAASQAASEAWEAKAEAEVSRVNALAYAVDASFNASSCGAAAGQAALSYAQASGAAQDADASKMAALEAKAQAQAAAAEATNTVNNASAIVVGNVQSYVTAAANSASNAAISEANALTSRNQAGSFATTATNSATAAAISASAANGSASSAASSAAAAASSAASLDTSTFVQKANNLSDIVSPSTARTNLGLGSAATQASSAFAPATHTHNVGDISGLSSALVSYAPLSSPNFTDTPTAPTASSSTDSTQLATTAYVRGQPNAYALRNASIKEYSSPITKELQVTTDFRIDLVCLDISKQGKTVNFSTSGSYSIYTGSGSIDISYNNADDVATICSNVNSLFPGFTLTFTDLSYNGPYYTFDPGYSFVLERYSYPVSINSGEEVMFKDHMRTYVLNEAVSRGASGSWDGYALTLTGMNGGTPDFTFSNPWVTYAYSKGDCDAYFAPYSWVYANFYTQTQGDGRYSRLASNNTHTSGGQLFAASTTTYPTLSIPHGVAPTSLLNGYMWSTTAGLFMRINGVTQTFATLAGGTFTGPIITPASTTSAAGLRIPNGTAPTTPTDGDVWTINGASGSFLWRAGGVTYAAPALGVANTYTAAARQQVSHSTASSGLRIAAVASDITTPVAGDVWTNSTPGQILGFSNSMRGAMTAVRAFAAVTSMATTPVVSSNYNVTSVTDNGVGDITLNFTNALVDANYGVTGCAGTSSTQTTSVVQNSTTARTASACRILVSQANAAIDPTFVTVEILR